MNHDFIEYLRNRFTCRNIFLVKLLINWYQFIAFDMKKKTNNNDNCQQQKINIVNNTMT